MHKVELLERAIAVAERLGFQVRHEWLDGAGGGHCVLGGQKTLFLDLSHDTGDQLDRVVEAIRNDPGLVNLASTLSPDLATLVRSRRAA